MVKKLVFGILLFLLLYTRFVNIGWGLPYPFHPDERNMAVAIQELNCELKAESQKLKECFDPQFYAYGQLPLYLGYSLVYIMKFFDGDLNTPVGFQEATIALRFISALSSVLLVYILFKIVTILTHKKVPIFKLQAAGLLLLIFQPYAIQFAHFGTTESLLMLIYTTMVYLSLLIEKHTQKNYRYLLYLFCLLGIAVGIKTSSVLFSFLPILIFVRSVQKMRFSLITIIKQAGAVISLSFLSYCITSPHNLIHWNDFLYSLQYESSVGMGTYVPFYTRQFIHTTSGVFQFASIFPYVLGFPVFFFSLCGFLFLSWKSAYLNSIRFAISVFLLPHLFFFAKWTRFVTPVLPLMAIFAILFLYSIYLSVEKKLKKHHLISFFLLLFIFLSSFPGLSFLSVYTNPDARFQASEWIYSHIPEGSKILTETNNVIDLPLPVPNSSVTPKPYAIHSFNFYDIDTNPLLYENLNTLVKEADYIIIPSRRIFMNHQCPTKWISNFQGPQNITEFPFAKKNCNDLIKQYPLLNTYYSDLFSSKLGFKQVAEFNSYPKLSFFGKTIIEFPDEQAEETWTVFDHPVVRIYKKVRSQESGVKSPNKPDFSSYKTTIYRLPLALRSLGEEGTSDFRLLIADTPQKWQQGLMYVRSKEDINGLDGMLFQFPDSQVRTFWNKNTLVDLDLYWINNKKVVGTVFLPSITKTGEVTTVSSPSSTDTVVEIIR